MDYISYNSHMSIAMTYGVVIEENKLFSIVTNTHINIVQWLEMQI